MLGDAFVAGKVAELGGGWIRRRGSGRVVDVCEDLGVMRLVARLSLDICDQRRPGGGLIKALAGLKARRVVAQAVAEEEETPADHDHDGEQHAEPYQLAAPTLLWRLRRV